jgi:hypothetical protein
MYEEIQFSRSQLFRMVWESPVLVVAKEIGISDVALSKACRKAGIPLPGRGYWAAAKSGQIAPKPKLPGKKPGQSDLVHFRILKKSFKVAPISPLHSVPPIPIPDRLHKPHRLVMELQTAATKATEDKGVLLLHRAKVLHVRTSRQCLQRSLIVLDVLLKQFESQGYIVQVEGESKETKVMLKEGTVSFRLDERTKQIRPPEPERVGKKGRQERAYESWRPAYLLKGTGELTLEFNKYRLAGCRHTWKDRPGLPLETQLHEVLEAIPSWEATLKAARAEAEEQEARYVAEEKRRVEVARAKEVLRRQRALLVENLQAWERAERLRRFVDAVISIAEPCEEAGAWVEWANAQIQALDPLTSNQRGLLNLDVKLEEYYTGPSSWEKPIKDWWG